MTTSRQYLLSLVLSLPVLALAITCASLDISHRVMKQKVMEVFDWSAENNAAGCILRVIFYSPSQPVRATLIQITNPHRVNLVGLLECVEGCELLGTFHEFSDWSLMPDEQLNFTYFCILSNLSNLDYCALQNTRLIEAFGPLHDVENEKRNASFVCRSGIPTPRREFLLSVKKSFRTKSSVVRSSYHTIAADSDLIFGYTMGDSTFEPHAKRSSMA